MNKPLYLLWVSISQAAAAGQQACMLVGAEKSCSAVRHVLRAPREALIISVECITQYKSVPKTERRGRLAYDREKDIGRSVSLSRSSRRIASDNVDLIIADRPFAVPSLVLVPSRADVSAPRDRNP